MRGKNPSLEAGSSTEFDHSPDEKPSDGRVQFHYLKSNYFRVVLADGAWGGVTPTTGRIQIVFYNDRAPIPQSVTHAVKNGHLGEEIVDERVTKTGVVREVEVAVTLDLGAAESLHTWLGEKVKILQELKKRTP